MVENDIQFLIKQAYDLGLSKYKTNIFTKEGFVEMNMASILGHRWNPIIRSNPDAWESENTPTEYKSFDVNKGYKSIQFCGMTREKLEGLMDHDNLYLAYKDGVDILKIERFNMSDIIDIVDEKLGDSDKKQIIINVNKLDIDREVVYECC